MGILGVSVPIRGLFNLTEYFENSGVKDIPYVSVPIRGLFNLTEVQEIYSITEY